MPTEDASSARSQMRWVGQLRPLRSMTPRLGAGLCRDKGVLRRRTSITAGAGRCHPGWQAPCSARNRLQPAGGPRRDHQPGRLRPVRERPVRSASLVAAIRAHDFGALIFRAQFYPPPVLDAAYEYYPDETIPMNGWLRGITAASPPPRTRRWRAGWMPERVETAILSVSLPIEQAARWTAHALAQLGRPGTAQQGDCHAGQVEEGFRLTVRSAVRRQVALTLQGVTADGPANDGGVDRAAAGHAALLVMQWRAGLWYDGERLFRGATGPRSGSGAPPSITRCRSISRRSSCGRAPAPANSLRAFSFLCAMLARQV